MRRNTQSPGHPGHFFSAGVAAVLAVAVVTGAGVSDSGDGSESGFVIEDSVSVAVVAGVSAIVTGAVVTGVVVVVAAEGSLGAMVVAEEGSVGAVEVVSSEGSVCGHGSGAMVDPFSAGSVVAMKKMRVR